MVLLTLAFLFVRLPIDRARWIGPIADPAHPVTPLTGPQTAAAARIRGKLRRARRWLPFNPVCLPRALAARWMLARRGIPNSLYFGARPAADRAGLDYHAWLEAGTLCITGAHERETYRVFGPSARAR